MKIVFEENWFPGACEVLWWYKEGMEVTVLIDWGYERGWRGLNFLIASNFIKDFYPKNTNLLSMSDKESVIASLALALGKQGEIKTVYVTTRLTCLLPFDIAYIGRMVEVG